MISAVVITKNEEKNIEKCIRSVLWCDELIIVDDYSTDFTIHKIKNIKDNVKIYKRHLDNDFAAQRNYGLSKAESEWVLFLDADEIVPQKLQMEILSKINIFYKSKVSGFTIKRNDVFMGREMKYGEVGNIRLLRLGKKNKGRWKRKVHEYWDINSEVGELNNPIIHNKQSLRDFVRKINNYSTIHAEELKKEGKSSNIFKVIIWPTAKFFVNYFFKFGFLDGIQGFIMAFFMSFHSFLAWSTVWIS